VDSSGTGTFDVMTLSGVREGINIDFFPSVCPGAATLLRAIHHFYFRPFLPLVFGLQLALMGARRHAVAQLVEAPWPLTEMSTRNISWGVKAVGAYG
jgi:hypothetical protein